MDIRPLPTTPKQTSSPIEREATSASPSVGKAATIGALPGETVAGEGKEADLQQSVERINQSLTASNQGIEFSVDADSERVIVKVVDRETREVLRQMPTQEALDIAKALDRTQGLLIRQEA